MIRHCTVTAFVCERGATLLHWHASNAMWLPPGGHIEADEDPIEAVHREVLEETGLTVAVLPTAALLRPTPSRRSCRPRRRSWSRTSPITPSTGRTSTSTPSTSRARRRPASRSARAGPGSARAPCVRTARCPPCPMTELVEIAEDVRVLGLAAIERALDG